MITVHTVPILNDNYAYVLEADNGDIAVIDPGEARPVTAFLEKKGFTPNVIFLTHHHSDHIAGAEAIQQYFRCEVVGPSAETDKIPFMDKLLDENSTAWFGDEKIQIIETPGHTLGQINYFFPENKLLFSGDTLFVMGCGRVFEGTMAQMYSSLQKLAELPNETKIYCGHEYTLPNTEFLLSVAPDNQEIKARYKTFLAMRQENEPTIPSTIGEEKRANLFLMARSAEEFSDLRKQKDRF